MQMRKFDVCCPKCGFAELKMSYVDNRNYRAANKVNLSEFLDVYCSKCGYDYKMCCKECHEIDSALMNVSEGDNNEVA